MPNELTRTERVAAEIRAELARQQKTVNQLADETGMSISTLRRSINGHRSLTLDELAAIARQLNVQASQLLRRTDISQQPAA